MGKDREDTGRNEVMMDLQQGLTGLEDEWTSSLNRGLVVELWRGGGKLDKVDMEEREVGEESREIEYLRW